MNILAGLVPERLAHLLAIVIVAEKADALTTCDAGQVDAVDVPFKSTRRWCRGALHSATFKPRLPRGHSGQFALASDVVVNIHYGAQEYQFELVWVDMSFLSRIDVASHDDVAEGLSREAFQSECADYADYAFHRTAKG